MNYPETLSQVLSKLEPESGFEGCAHDALFTPERRALLSQAISVKRIADFICGAPGNCDVVEYLSDALAGRR